MTIKAGELLTMDPTLGEIAYNGFAEFVGWKTEEGDALAPYTHQPATIQDAWDAAAEAVAEYLERTN